MSVATIRPSSKMEGISGLDAPIGISYVCVCKVNDPDPESMSWQVPDGWIKLNKGRAVISFGRVAGNTGTTLR